MGPVAIHTNPTTGILEVTTLILERTKTVHPVSRLPGETDAEYLESILQKDIPWDMPTGTPNVFTQRPYRVIDARELPDPTLADPYRDAWQDGGERIAYNMVRAAAICRERLLRERDAALLTATVGAFLGRTGAARKLQRLANLEQALAETLAKADSIDDLKTITLDSLITEKP